MASATNSIEVSATIGGSGRLTITNAANSISSGGIYLTASNSYSGGTRIINNATLFVNSDGALGAGFLTLTSGKVMLSGGVTNNYIADSATFSVASGLTESSVSLGFTGYDMVGALSLDGGSTFVANGLYSVSALNALYGSNAFSGSGGLAVGVSSVPEPSAAAALAGLWVLGIGICCRRCVSKV